jgi:hypothetical protein
VERYFARNTQTALRFITLNYTKVLENIFSNRDRQILGQNYFVVNHIHHIHGSVDRKISLGVNDESQISSYVDTNEKNFLIKPRLIERMNDRRIEILQDYITLSNIAVLFGLSIGATDKYIWEKIIDWLCKGDKLLIIHHYEEGLIVDDLTERESLQLEDRVKNKFLDYSGLDNDTKNSLKNKIYVIPNSTVLFSRNIL